MSTDVFPNNNLVLDCRVEPLNSLRVGGDDLWFELLVERRGNGSRMWCNTQLVEPHPVSQGDGDDRKFGVKLEPYLARLETDEMSNGLQHRWTLGLRRTRRRSVVAQRRAPRPRRPHLVV